MSCSHINNGCYYKSYPVNNGSSHSATATKSTTVKHQCCGLGSSMGSRGQQGAAGAAGEGAAWATSAADLGLQRTTTRTGPSASTNPIQTNNIDINNDDTMEHHLGLPNIHNFEKTPHRRP